MDTSALVAVVGGYLRGKKESIDEQQRRLEAQKQLDLQQRQLDATVAYQQGLLKEGQEELAIERDKLAEQKKQNERLFGLQQFEVEKSLAIRVIDAEAGLTGVEVELSQAETIAINAGVSIIAAQSAIVDRKLDRQTESIEKGLDRGALDRRAANMLLGQGALLKTESDLRVQEHVATATFDNEWAANVRKSVSQLNLITTLFDYQLEEQSKEKEALLGAGIDFDFKEYGSLLQQDAMTGDFSNSGFMATDMSNKYFAAAGGKDTPVSVMLSRAGQMARVLTGGGPDDAGITQGRMEELYGQMTPDQQAAYMAIRETIGGQAAPLNEKAAVMIQVTGGAHPQIAELRRYAFPWLAEETPQAAAPTPPVLSAGLPGLEPLPALQRGPSVLPSSALSLPQSQPQGVPAPVLPGAYGTNAQFGYTPGVSELMSAANAPAVSAVPELTEEQIMGLPGMKELTKMQQQLGGKERYGGAKKKVKKLRSRLGRIPTTYPG